MDTSPAVPKTKILQILNYKNAVTPVLTFPKSGITSPAVEIKSLQLEAGGSLATLLKPANVTSAGGSCFLAVAANYAPAFALFDYNLYFLSDYVFFASAFFASTFLALFLLLFNFLAKFVSNSVFTF